MTKNEEHKKERDNIQREAELADLILKRVSHKHQISMPVIEEQTEFKQIKANLVLKTPQS